MKLADLATEPSWIQGWDERAEYGPGALARLRFDSLTAAMESEEWGAHEWCSLVACRAPLHPGPCKGWKHTLHAISPGAWRTLEHDRVEKLNRRRLAKVAQLKSEGKAVPPALLKEIEPRSHPGTPPPGWKPGELAPGAPAADAAKVAAAPSAKVGQKAAHAKGPAHRAGAEVARHAEQAKTAEPSATAPETPRRLTDMPQGERLDMIAKLGGTVWHPPGGGAPRYYVNDWHGLAGLEVERYKTGNISSATLDGEPISNAKALKLGANGKVWIDPAGNVHSQGLPDDMAARLSRGVDAKVREGLKPEDRYQREPVKLAEAAKAAGVSPRARSAELGAEHPDTVARREGALAAARSPDHARLREAISKITPADYKTMTPPEKRLINDRLQFEMEKGDADRRAWARRAVAALSGEAGDNGQHGHEATVGEVISQGMFAPAAAPARAGLTAEQRKVADSAGVPTREQLAHIADLYDNGSAGWKALPESDKAKIRTALERAPHDQLAVDLLDEFDAADHPHEVKPDTSKLGPTTRQALVHSAGSGPLSAQSLAGLRALGPGATESLPGLHQRKLARRLALTEAAGGPNAEAAKALRAPAPRVESPLYAEPAPARTKLSEAAQKADLAGKLAAAQKAAGAGPAKGYSDHQSEAIRAVRGADHHRLRTAVANLTRSTYNEMTPEDRKLIHDRLQFEMEGGDADRRAWARRAVAALGGAIESDRKLDHEPSVGELISQGMFAAPGTKLAEAAGPSIEERARKSATFRVPGRGVAPEDRLAKLETLDKATFDSFSEVKRRQVLQRLDELAKGEGGPKLPDDARERARALHATLRAPATPTAAQMEARTSAEHRKAMAASPAGVAVRAEIARRGEVADKAAKARTAALRKEAGIPSDAAILKLSPEQRSAAQNYVHEAKKLANTQAVREKNRAQLEGMEAGLAKVKLTPQERADWDALAAEYEARRPAAVRNEDIPEGSPLHQELADARRRWDEANRQQAKIEALSSPGELARAIISGDIHERGDTLNEKLRRRKIYAQAPAAVLAGLTDAEKNAISRDVGTTGADARKIRMALGEIIHRPTDNPDLIVRETPGEHGSHLQLEHHGQILRKSSSIRPDLELQNHAQAAREANAHLKAGRNVHGQTPEEVAKEAEAKARDEARVAEIRGHIDDLAEEAKGLRLGQAAQEIRVSAAQEEARGWLRRAVEVSNDPHRLNAVLDSIKGKDLDRAIAQLPPGVQLKLPAGATASKKRTLLHNWAVSQEHKDSAAIGRLGHPLTPAEKERENEGFKRDRLAELGVSPGKAPAGPAEAAGPAGKVGVSPKVDAEAQAAKKAAPAGVINAWGGARKPGEYYYHPDHPIGQLIERLGAQGAARKISAAGAAEVLGVRKPPTGENRPDRSVADLLAQIATDEQTGAAPAGETIGRLDRLGDELAIASSARGPDLLVEKIAQVAHDYPKVSWAPRRFPSAGTLELKGLFDDLNEIPAAHAGGPSLLDRVALIAEERATQGEMARQVRGLLSGMHESTPGYAQAQKAVMAALDRLKLAQQAKGVAPKTWAPAGSGVAGYDADRAALEASSKLGHAHRHQLTGGAVGRTSYVRYADGREAVEKEITERAANAFSVPAVEQQDAEELAAELGRRLGLRTPAVHRMSPDTISMQFSPGRQARLAEANAMRGTAQAGALDLFDQVIDNSDRHEGNWLLEDGRIVPIDHGLSFRFKNGPQEPVRGQAFRSFPTEERMAPHPKGERDETGAVRRTRQGFFADHPATPADMARVRRELEAMRPAFEAKGRADWLEKALARVAAMEPHAKGTKNLLEG